MLRHLFIRFEEQGMLGDQNIYVINGIKVLKMYKINI